MSDKPVIINIYEANSDGEDTPCEVMIWVDRPVSDEDMAAVEDRIAEFQSEMKIASTEWETKTLARIAVEKLTELGYESDLYDYYKVIEV